MPVSYAVQVPQLGGVPVWPAGHPNIFCTGASTPEETDALVVVFGDCAFVEFCVAGLGGGAREVPGCLLVVCDLVPEFLMAGLD